MKTKEILLKKLIDQKGKWLSGEEIAAVNGVTRAAVWKAVKQLREEGYTIDAVQNKGYRLVDDADILSELGIWKHLNADCRMLDIHVLPEVGSTNVNLWKKAHAGSPEGTVLIAAMQTDGRGRLGKKFFSPADTGIYMSLLLRPQGLTSEQAFQITVIAAEAACETFEEAAGKKAQIKWVNDVFMDGRKVCGILTEGTIGIETGLLDAVVVGIGINVYRPEDGFPPELEPTAGAVFEKKQNEGKNILAAGFLNRFMGYYLSRDYGSIFEKYKQRNFVIGKNIHVIRNGICRNAAVKDIDSSCRLVVEYEDGTEGRLLSGEDRIRVL